MCDAASRDPSNCKRNDAVVPAALPLQTYETYARCQIDPVYAIHDDIHTPGQ